MGLTPMLLTLGFLGLAVLLGKNIHKVKRLITVNTLFREDLIVNNFRNLHDIGFNVVNVSTRGAPVAQLDASAANTLSLPESFHWNGTEFQMRHWLDEHWTTGLVVIKRDADTQARVLHEEYLRGNNEQSRCVSWSMCKSVMSALIGIAVKQDIIGDIKKETVTDYVPELLNTGYDGVKIEDVLQMSSGIHFTENYFDPLSDINMMGYTIALGWSIDSFVASLKRGEQQPGTMNNYVSMDTQVLAMILTRAANTTLESFAEEHLWSKVGFADDATWVLDNDIDRTALAFGILGVTTRDYARFGWLYLNKGVSPASGERILPEEWVSASLSADKPHLVPGEQNTMSNYPTFGYGYQWWLCPTEEDPSKPSNDFMAIGVYGQLIYVSPDDGIVIAKNAADPHYADMQSPTSHENYLETQGFQALRAISKAFRSA
mmetsp:Transcript_24715/g.41789  ORF Transcript_24715/g.41789 Transcript_24715/m.41789 type:complete len:432 (-) Transcript_24715:170-1465(-)